MNTLPLLVRREYWEHRGGFLWTPAWITGVILVLTVIGILGMEALHGNITVGVGSSLGELRQYLDAHDIARAGNALDVMQLSLAGMVAVGVFFVSFFYLLGALYDDRRDRSVLFWKSLPISDTATVLSKVLAALVLVPLLALAVATLAYLLLLLITLAWAALHGLNLFPAIAGAHPLRMLASLLTMIVVGIPWALPTAGWLLFWSAWAKSRPLLWAVLVPVLALIANAWLGVLGAPHVPGGFNLGRMLARALFSVAPGSWLGGPASFLNVPRAPIPLVEADIVASLSPMRQLGLLATADLWIGVAVGAALLAAAVWLRGRRVEASV